MRGTRCSGRRSRKQSSFLVEHKRLSQSQPLWTLLGRSLQRMEPKSRCLLLSVLLCDQQRLCTPTCHHNVRLPLVEPTPTDLLAAIELRSLGTYVVRRGDGGESRFV